MLKFITAINWHCMNYLKDSKPWEGIGSLSRKECGVIDGYRRGDVCFVSWGESLSGVGGFGGDTSSARDRQQHGAATGDGAADMRVGCAR